MKLLFLRFSLITLFATSLAACGGSGTTRSYQGSFTPPETSTPETPPSENVSPPNPDLGDGFDDDETQVEGGNGSTVPDTPSDPEETPQENFCAVPEDSAPNYANLLGKTSDKDFYNIESYVQDTSGSDLTGTWIVTANADTKDTALSSLNLQRYALVIKKDSNNKYQAANCSGLAVKDIESKEVCTIFDGTSSKEVPCNTAGAQPKPDLVLHEEYLPWADYIKINYDGKPETRNVTLPLYLPSLFQPAEGIGFTLQGDSYSEMKSESGTYQAVKISNTTSALGKSSIDIRGNQTKDADVTCVVHSKIIVHSCQAETTNTLAAIFAATSKDLHQIVAADSPEAANQYMLLNSYIIAGDKLTSPSSVGRFTRDATATVSNANTVAVDDQTTSLDIEISGATDPSSIKLNIDLNRAP